MRINVLKLFLLFGLCSGSYFCTSCKNNLELEIRKETTKQDQYYSSNDIVNKEGFSKVFDYRPSSTTKQLIYHDYYTLSYNEKYEQAEWVAYELKQEYLIKNKFKRPLFIKDPKVVTSSADWKNYKNSGYDKGHLCPAADMDFSKKAFKETFFTSNISPQLHVFNNGVWKRLEEKVRYWAQKYDGIYVVTGGVLNPTLKTIGKENVAVPEYFYKILMDDTNGKYRMIAFMIPNEKSDKPLYSFVVTVDSVEKITGIDFFPKLVDETEDRLEKSSDYKAWSFN
jgi:endonuclease G, mitochondrial